MSSSLDEVTGVTSTKSVRFSAFIFDKNACVTNSRPVLSDFTLTK